uniref:Uncharacterized protein n=1 Tax=Cacopsylla melanoneura TaxID=428564 RepID=A0A8D8RFT2_9HEMI
MSLFPSLSMFPSLFPSLSLLPSLLPSLSVFSSPSLFSSLSVVTLSFFLVFLSLTLFKASTFFLIRSSVRLSSSAGGTNVTSSISIPVSVVCSSVVVGFSGGFVV